MKKCTIRVKATGQVITVKSYGNGWIDAKGNILPSNNCGACKCL